MLEWAAFAVTALAVLLVWSQTNRISKRADAIQERLAVVEEDRRQSELAPRFHATFVEEEVSSPGIRLENLGPIDYEKVAVTLVRPGVGNAGGPWGAARDEPGPIRCLVDRVTTSDRFYVEHLDLGPLAYGKDIFIHVERNHQHDGGVARFVVTCSAGFGRWATVVQCEVSPDPTTSVW